MYDIAKQGTNYFAIRVQVHKRLDFDKVLGSKRKKSLEILKLCISRAWAKNPTPNAIVKIRKKCFGIPVITLNLLGTC